MSSYLSWEFIIVFILVMGLGSIILKLLSEFLRIKFTQLVGLTCFGYLIYSGILALKAGKGSFYLGSRLSVATEVAIGVISLGMFIYILVLVIKDKLKKPAENTVAEVNQEIKEDE